jgi:uncharacterized protein (DUF2062 family)
MLGAPPSRQSRWRRLRHAVVRALRSVALLEDTPYRIGMGSAAGVFASALPIFGQTFAGMIIARVLRGNVIASIPWSWISNPVTTLPMWYAGYRLGVWMMPGDQPALSYAELARLADVIQNASWSEGWRLLLATALHVLAPLWIGTCLIGLVMAVPAFFILRRLAELAARRRSERLQSWARRASPPLG